VTTQWQYPPPPVAPSRLAIGVILLGIASVVLIGAWVLWVVLVPVLGLPFFQVESYVTPVVRLDGRTLLVKGTANLPDGAVLDYGVSQESGVDRFVGGVATVQHGEFSFWTDLAGWSAGKASVNIVFAVGWDTTQPQNVVDTYGGQGERMTGEQVWTDSGDKHLELTVPVEIPPQPAS
jgi:hypothetical protein